MKQKFRKLTFVQVANEMPPEMAHFDKGFKGIVDGTYSQIYGGKDIKSYSIFKINRKGDKVVNCIAWYDESQLTELPDQDREKAEEMIEKYNLKR